MANLLRREPVRAWSYSALVLAVLGLLAFRGDDEGILPLLLPLVLGVPATEAARGAVTPVATSGRGGGPADPGDVGKVL